MLTVMLGTKEALGVVAETCGIDLELKLTPEAKTGRAKFQGLPRQYDKNLSQNKKVWSCSRLWIPRQCTGHKSLGSIPHTVGAEVSHRHCTPR